MGSGAYYDFSAPEIMDSIRHARRCLERFNRAGADDEPARREALGELIPGIPASATVVPPFFCDHGHPIRLGEGVFVNTGCTFLDSGGIAVGARTLIGPDCRLLTPEHRQRGAPPADRAGTRHNDRRGLLAVRRRDGLSGGADRRPCGRGGGERRHARCARRRAGRGQSGRRETHAPLTARGRGIRSLRSVSVCGVSSAAAGGCVRHRDRGRDRFPEH